MQQAPRASTATPSPPHTPHASTVAGATQQAPSASSEPAQHLPVRMSTSPMQHAPRTSTTPSTHASVCAAAAWPSSGTSHVSPAHRRLHLHMCVTESHSQWSVGLGQSLWVRHSHCGPGSSMHVVVLAGRGPLELHTASGSSTRSMARTQVTARLCCPERTQLEEPEAVCAAASGLQVDQGPVDHTDTRLGHGNRLQGRVVAGGFWKTQVSQHQSHHDG